MDIGDRIYGWIRRPETPLAIKNAIRAEDVIALVTEFRAVKNDALERAAEIADMRWQNDLEPALTGDEIRALKTTAK